MSDELLEQINQMRTEKRLLTIPEVIALEQRGNKIYDPLSVIISRKAVIGNDNIFYPGVVILCGDKASLVIGSQNSLGTGTCITVEGEAKFVMGNGCRTDGAVRLYNQCFLGDGSQVLGFIQAYDCCLEAGGNHQEPDPNLRGGVLKGAGRAKGLQIRRGFVINGNGDFRQEQEELQIHYHPDPVY